MKKNKTKQNKKQNKTKKKQKTKTKNQQPEQQQQTKNNSFENVSLKDSFLCVKSHLSLKDPSYIKYLWYLPHWMPFSLKIGAIRLRPLYIGAPLKINSLPVLINNLILAWCAGPQEYIFFLYRCTVQFCRTFAVKWKWFKIYIEILLKAIKTHYFDSILLKKTADNIVKQIHRDR